MSKLVIHPVSCMHDGVLFSNKSECVVQPTARLGFACLPEGVAFEEPLSLSLYCQEMVGVDGHCCISSIMVSFDSGFFSPPRHSFGLI